MSDGMNDSMNAVPSPCNDVCTIHVGSGFCVGCGRTIDEIVAWSRLDDAAKLRVWSLLPQRRVQLDGQRAGTPAAAPAPASPQEPR